eukprot:COSAG02_NODE_58250_length_278_cov_0.569832_1_plen_75_part_01
MCCARTVCGRKSVGPISAVISWSVTNTVYCGLSESCCLMVACVACPVLIACRHAKVANDSAMHRQRCGQRERHAT